MTTGRIARKLFAAAYLAAFLSAGAWAVFTVERHFPGTLLRVSASLGGGAIALAFLGACLLARRCMWIIFEREASR